MLSPLTHNPETQYLFTDDFTLAQLSEPVAVGEQFEPTTEDLQIGQVRAAAASGCPVSQLFLGTYFLMPTRKSAHLAEAIEWLESASKQGCQHATGLLSALCLEKARRVLLKR